MQDFLFFLVVGAGFGINAYQLYRQARDPKERQRRAFARARRTPIDKIKEGEWVKVMGTVAAVGPTMTSPLSQRECIGFWSEVDSVQQNSVVTRREGHCGAFSITDETGQVIVAGPFQLMFEIEQPWARVPAEHVEFLLRIGMSMEALRTDGRMREELLLPGDRISAFGLALLEPDAAAPSTGFRSPPLVRHLRGEGRRSVMLGPADGEAGS